MPPKRRRRFQGLYYHSTPPKVIPMNGQVLNGRRRRDTDVKLSTIRIWMHEKDIGKLTRLLWAGQGHRLSQQASTNGKVKRFLAAVPYVMNSIKDVHQAVIDNSLETLQTKVEPPVPPSLITCKDANGLNIIHKAAGLGHATILEYLLGVWPDGINETDITGKTPLHWAASAKNNMRCYTLLTQAGADEEALDYKMRSPSYYRHKPHEIERAFLVYLPEAPRVSPGVPTDWEALAEDGFDGKKLDIKIPEMNGIDADSTADDMSDPIDGTKQNGAAEPEEMADATPETPLPTPEANETAESTENNESASAAEEETPAELAPEVATLTEEENNSARGGGGGGGVGGIGFGGGRSGGGGGGGISESEGDGAPAVRGEGALSEPDEQNDNEEQNEERNEEEKPDQEANEEAEPNEEAALNEEEEEQSEAPKNEENDVEADETQAEDEKNENGEASEIAEEAKEEPQAEEDETVNNDADDGNEDEEEAATEAAEDNAEAENDEEAKTEENSNIEDDEQTEMHGDDEAEGDELNDPIANEKTEEQDDDDDDEAANENTANGEDGNDENAAEGTEAGQEADQPEVADSEENAGEDVTTDGQIDVAETDQKDADGEEQNDNVDASDKKNDKTKTDEHVEEDDDEQDVVVTPSAHKLDLNHNESKHAINGAPEDDGGDVGDEIEAESHTSSLAIEGFVHGDSEDNTVQSQSAAIIDEEANLKQIIASGDMEQLAQIVLNGDGRKLQSFESAEPDIQAFLNNVPTYMTKIRRVHEAARLGSLLSLQQALDRRKFAIAKDDISPHGATPLHVAVLFGHSDIVRYLAARFPETTSISDQDGRTALHYAATIKDNGHFYNLLTQLGANAKALDKLGHTPEFYADAERAKGVLSYGQLLKNFGAEELEEELLSDQGQVENQVPPSYLTNPIFKTEQGKYLADTLADPLIKALTQIAHKRPADPVSFLATFLQRYAQDPNSPESEKTNSTAAMNSSSPAVVKTDNAQTAQRQVMSNVDEIRQAGDEDDELGGTPNNDDRDEHGQSMLHFACARSHRRGGLMHLIEESSIDITYRDELYRTARDVSLQANQPTNAKEIDRYVLSLAVVGDMRPFEQFALNGYDHVVDVTDDGGRSITDIITERGFTELADFLGTLRPLEELREEFHQMIRDVNIERIREIMDGSDAKWLLRAKNYYGRTALHIAVLKESEEIVELLVGLNAEILKIGDNLERTALHYAMGTNAIESISRILIQNGAKRTSKDLKGRQPSYYFMNKADILRLQEEEEETR